MDRPCLDCGQPTPASRCPACRRRRDRARGSPSRRGYDAAHRRARAAAIAAYQPSDPCARCGQPLGPDPALLDLGHTDDRQAWTGLEHRRCNRATARRRRTS